MSRRGFQGPRWDPDIIVLGQVVPDDFAETLRRMHKMADPRLDGVLLLAVKEGWTGVALGNALWMTRERIYQRAARADGEVCGVDIPPPPRRVHPPKPVRRELSPDVAERLRGMQEIARTVNGATPADDPRREISVEYSALLASLLEEGFTTYYLAKVIGITHGAIRFRLGRHGFMRQPPSMADDVYLGEPRPALRVRRQVTP